MCVALADIVVVMPSFGLVGGGGEKETRLLLNRVLIFCFLGERNWIFLKFELNIFKLINVSTLSFLLTFKLISSIFSVQFVWRPWLNSPGKVDKRVSIIPAFSEYSKTRVSTKFAFEQLRRKDRLLYWNSNAIPFI